MKHWKKALQKFPWEEEVKKGLAQCFPVPLILRKRSFTYSDKIVQIVTN